MYQISEKSWAIEYGDNISFVRDGGGQMQVFVGDCEAMRSHDLDGGPHTRVEGEMVVLEVRSLKAMQR